LLASLVYRKEPQKAENHDVQFKDTVRVRVPGVSPGDEESLQWKGFEKQEGFKPPGIQAGILGNAGADPKRLIGMRGGPSGKGLERGLSMAPA